jgi:hypothetical protein
MESYICSNIKYYFIFVKYIYLEFSEWKIKKKKKDLELRGNKISHLIV